MQQTFCSWKMLFHYFYGCEPQYIVDIFMKLYAIHVYHESVIPLYISFSRNKIKNGIVILLYTLYSKITLLQYYHVLTILHNIIIILLYIISLPKKYYGIVFQLQRRECKLFAHRNDSFLATPLRLSRLQYKNNGSQPGRLFLLYKH